MQRVIDTMYLYAKIRCVSEYAYVFFLKNSKQPCCSQNLTYVVSGRTLFLFGSMPKMGGDPTSSDSLVRGGASSLPTIGLFSSVVRPHADSPAL